MNKRNRGTSREQERNCHKKKNWSGQRNQGTQEKNQETIALAWLGMKNKDRYTNT